MAHITPGSGVVGERRPAPPPTTYAPPQLDSWVDRPADPANPLTIHPLSLAGESVEAKLARTREALKEAECGAVVLNALDQIAWLYNLRGSDISCNPVFFAYVGWGWGGGNHRKTQRSVLLPTDRSQRRSTSLLSPSPPSSPSQPQPLLPRAPFQPPPCRPPPALLGTRSSPRTRPTCSSAWSTLRPPPHPTQRRRRRKPLLTRQWIGLARTCVRT